MVPPPIKRGRPRYRLTKSPFDLGCVVAIGFAPDRPLSQAQRMSNIPSLQEFAAALGGEISGLDVVAPGPGHSSVDRSMSVRPVDGAPDGFVVHSFAGDDPIDCKNYVREKLGLTREGKPGKKTREPIAEFIYRTEAGEPYLRVQKFHDASGKKQFPQAHWDGKKWIPGKPEGPKLPYRLPELAKAASTATVYFVEGEKSADKLTGLGFIATCVSEGAQAAWPKEVAQWFKGRHVVVLPDNDTPGIKAAYRTANGLCGVAELIRVLDLAPHWPGEGMPAGFDVFDWVERHDRAGARLAQLGKEAPLYGPQSTKADAGPALDGAQILTDVHEFIGRFVAYPTEHAHVAHTLWIAHTHGMEAWDSTPRIAFLSPEPGSGKTRALEVTEPLVPGPVEAVNVTSAYLFRKVGGEGGPPTILHDEIDTVFSKAKENEEIRGLLNAGHRRGAVVGRCIMNGKTVETEEISAYCAVALAGLGWLPDTLMSRSIIIRMRRRAPGEVVEPYRRRDEIETATELRNRLTTWAAARIGILQAMRPAMPTGIEDRAADVWEAPFAIADAAGGDWPSRARAAAVALVEAAMDKEPSLGIRLLADLRTIAAGYESCEAFPSKFLVSALCALEDAALVKSPGPDAGYARVGLSSAAVRIRPQQVRRGDFRVRVYTRPDLADAWARYLPPVIPATPVTSVTPVTDAERTEEFVTDVHGRGARMSRMRRLSRMSQPVSRTMSRMRPPEISTKSTLSRMSRVSRHLRGTGASTPRPFPLETRPASSVAGRSMGPSSRLRSEMGRQSGSTKSASPSI